MSPTSCLARSDTQGFASDKSHFATACMRRSFVRQQWLTKTARKSLSRRRMAKSSMENRTGKRGELQLGLIAPASRPMADPPAASERGSYTPTTLHSTVNRGIVARGILIGGASDMPNVRLQLGRAGTLTLPTNAEIAAQTGVLPHDFGPIY